MAKVKNFFKKTGIWFKNHAPTKRRLIQIYAALLYNANIKGFITGNIYRGNTKYACVPGLNCYSCPGAVGACPLGALQDSMAHSDKTAPYYIIGILALFGLMFARTICGFLCPVGLGQELLYKIKTPKVKKSRYTRILSYFKYVLLILLVIAVPLITHSAPGFCKYVCPAGTFGGSGGLLVNPVNSSYFETLKFLFSWKFVLLVVFIVLSIFIFRFFCRFICPLGAIYGFFNKYALIGVKLEDDKCVNCGLCLETCKMDIRRVGDHECINCGEFIPVCPTKAISWKGSKIVLYGLDKTPQPETETVPLTAMAQHTAQDDAETQIQPVESDMDGGNAADGETAVKEAKPVLTYEQRLKKRSFWLQFGAWAVALCVLAGALIYYNFIVKEPDFKVYYVNDLFINEQTENLVLDTVFETAGSKKDGEQIESITLSDFKGKVTVINFWYTMCGPCVAELPEFEEMKREYGDSINMIAVHSDNGLNLNKIQEFIDAEDSNKTVWSDWQIIFTHDLEGDYLYNSLGGRGGYPMTAILDKQGKITFTYSNAIEKETLKTEIEKALLK